MSRDQKMSILYLNFMFLFGDLLHNKEKSYSPIVKYLNMCNSNVFNDNINIIIIRI